MERQPRRRDFCVNASALEVEARPASSTVLEPMTFIDKLERRLGFIAIPGLLRYVAYLSALVFVLYKLDPSYLRLIDLDAHAVLRGQVWRLVTYIFVPQLGSLLPFPDWVNAAFYALFLLWMGNGLEAAWGSFRLTLFFLIGVMGTTVAAFFFGAAFSNIMLTSSLFFAFARFYPDTVIYFAYVLPLKVKWIAWGTAAFLLFQFVFQTIAYRAAFLMAMANYLIFFGPEIYRSARNRKDVTERRRRFELDSRSADADPLHKCATCGATELSDSNLEFRVSRDGEEYCLAHLPRPANAPVSPR
jgi:hypothetical protein